MSKGQTGINKLDGFCREHDIAYHQNKDLKNRHEADKVLIERAWERVKAPDSSLGEKVNAWIVTNAMKAKVKLGLGVKSRKEQTMKKEQMKKKKGAGCPTFNRIVKKAKAAIKNAQKKRLNEDVAVAIKSLKRINKNKLKVPRVIPIPKSGGFLPLIPLLSG